MGASSSDVVGRERELATVGALLDVAASGTLTTVLIGGEPGIGKTSLAVAATARRPVVVAARCLPLSTLHLPFFALRGAVRAAHDQGGDDPFAGRADDAPEAFDRWLGALESDGPVVLLVDDLQWADRSTLDVLTYLVAGPADRPLAILGTWRLDDERTQPAFPIWHRDVRRLPGVDDLELGPLDRDGTARQLADLFGAPPHASLIDDLHGRTGGNPYLNRLLAADLHPSSRTVGAVRPDRLREAVAADLSRLAPAAREATAALAVTGRAMTAADLAAVVRLSPGRLGAELRGLREGRILDVDADRRYWFHHPLIAEAIVAELDEPELARRHRELADRYDALVAAEPGDGEHRRDLLVRRAEHRDRGGPPEAALTALLEAADAAALDGGSRDGVALLRRAADTAAALPGEERRRRAVLERLLDVALAAGDVEEEWRTIDELLALVDPDVEPLVAATLLVRRMHARFRSGRGFIDPADAEAALGLAAADPGSAAFAFANAELAHALAFRGDPRAEELSERASELADAAGSEAVRAYAHSARGLVAAMHGRSDAAAAAFDAAFEAALAAGDGWPAMRTAIWERGAHRDPRERAARLAERRRRLVATGAPWSCLAPLSAFEAGDLILIGDHRGAAARLRDALSRAPGPVGEVHARLQAARLAAWQGRVREARAQLERADELFADRAGFVSYPFAAVRAEVALAAGEPATAAAEAAAGLAAAGAPVAMRAWLRPLAARAFADAADASRAAGDPAAAQAHRAALDALLERHPASRPTADGFERASVDALEALCTAERTRAAGTADPAAWARAADALGSAGLAWEACLARFRSAEALLLAGPGEHDRAAGAAELRRMLAAARALESPLLVDLATDLAADARVRLDEPDEERAAAETVGAAADRPLTAREQEVLEHLLAGRTYPEIARALFISEKTVSSHVSSILRKTGARSRVELARRVRARAGAGGS